MKVTDLMVGDLVYIHEPECKGHRIDALDELDEQVGADGEVYDECDIRPIPLTEEILVKNGFVGVELTDSYELNTDYYEIEVWKYSDGLWVVNVQWIEFSSTPESKATVSYLHELQHFLKLCGIEKEITLTD